MSEVQDMPQASWANLPFPLKMVGSALTWLSPAVEDPDKLRLISIGISHYVEKVRWALDLGSREFTEDPHLPGVQMFYTLPVTKDKSMTPCLVTRNAETPFITDSTEILRYLQASDSSLSWLYPEDLAPQIADWEDYFDQQLGVAVRRFAYSHVLKDTALSLVVMTAELSNAERRMAPKMLFGIKRVVSREAQLWRTFNKIRR